MSDPLSNGPQSDRDSNGRFRPGHHSPGPGNPQLATLNRHRAAMLKGVKDRDIRRAMTTAIEIMDDVKVKPGDRLMAIRLLLERVLGVPGQADVLARIERLEALTTPRNGLSAPDFAPRRDGNGDG